MDAWHLAMKEAAVATDGEGGILLLALIVISLAFPLEQEGR